MANTNSQAPEADALIRADEQCNARQIDPEQRTVRFLAQSQQLASDNLIITANAGKKRAKEYMRNPIVVPYHRLAAFDDVTPIVVGNVVKDEFKPDGRYQTVRFATTDLAEQWWHLYAVDKVMRMVSIAWYTDGEKREEDPAKMVKLLGKHGINLKPDKLNRLRGVVTEYVQRDLSLVPIGADPDAMQHSADGGNGVAQGYMNGYEHTDGVWVPRAADTSVQVPGVPAQEEPDEQPAGDERSEGADDDATSIAPAAQGALTFKLTIPRELVADPSALGVHITDLIRAQLKPTSIVAELVTAPGADDEDTNQERNEPEPEDTPGEGGGAGDANAHTEPDAEGVGADYGDLLNFAKHIGRKPGHTPVPSAGMGDLIREAGTLSATLKTKTEKENENV